jgi:hypothetical protein
VAAPAPGVTLTGGTSAPDAYAQAQEMLRAHGVTWQRLETWGEGGEWKFSCSIPNPQNPSIRRNYEFRAPGEYGLAAIRAVLEQIERERR